MFVYLISILIFASNGAFGDTSRAMNDIKIDDFVHFEKKWKLVTVRYRKDSGEMRFTFANDLAWQALLSNSKNYPDGSIFGKMSFKTNPDISFLSSMVPHGKRRTQFMVRNKKKYKETRGWGYALFSSNGERYKGDIKTKSMACSSCHSLVSERGDVFSVPFFLTENGYNISKNQHIWSDKLKFKTINKNSLPEKLKALIRSEKVFSLQGKLKKDLFFGTLDEIRPLLIEKSKISKLPAALISFDKKLFSVVIPQLKSSCENPLEKKYMSAHTIQGDKGIKVLKMEFCY